MSPLLGSSRDSCCLLISHLAQGKTLRKSIVSGAVLPSLSMQVLSMAQVPWQSGESVNPRIYQK